jgi:Domain of unknown function (DUF4382)
MKKTKILFSTLLLIMAGVTIFSCSKSDSSSSTYPLNIRMTDEPGPYDAVFIDLRRVEITGNDNKAVTLNVHPGIYNLLDFSNGLDTLIAYGNLENPTVQQIRLILGPDNTVVVKNVRYPLSTPSAEQSGLKLQVHETMQAGVLYTILLDFDANKSIIQTGNGSYKLKPVIRSILVASSGSIKGKITPVGTSAYVTATSNGISYSSNVNENGEFLIMGLPAGIYSFTITPSLPLLPVTRNNIEVKTGVISNVGIIVF